MDIGIPREIMDNEFRVRTLVSTEHNIGRAVAESDLVIGAVLIPGRTSPRVVSREMVSAMRPGSVIVDVAIDQGGCVETARVTSHSQPVYEVDGVIHYCVANMPGAVPRTSTYALTNGTLPYVLAITDRGTERALRENAALQRGLNVLDGRIVSKEVAESQSREWLEPFQV